MGKALLRSLVIGSTAFLTLVDPMPHNLSKEIHHASLR
jgi:hypothetical protein